MALDASSHLRLPFGGYGGSSPREVTEMSGLPDLAGKVSIVTGGASGIGKGIAVEPVAEGAQVIIADIQRDAMEATAEAGR
jgi:S-adenosylhomocysteine hydrolase